MTFRQDILDGRAAVGPWMFAPNPIFVEMAVSVGIDFVLIDMEHGEVTLPAIPGLLRAGRGGRTALLVRPSSHDPATLSKLIDFGADGVVVPKVNNAAEAKLITDACRYPPAGQRGLAPGAIRASQYGLDTDYRGRAADHPLVAVQIETADGVANIEGIAAIDGIDMLFIGPNDLAAALGYPSVTPDAAPAIAEVIDKAAATGKKIGVLPYLDRGIEELKAAGVSFIASGSDIAAHREFLLNYKDQPGGY
jgi:2-keto-3-deoxy-L-rhamnonate aldolase RhmA